MNTPLTLSSYPRAILHLDADGFFASVEQALHPKLRGRPVITGAERGVVIAVSYEAKARGVRRGMRLFEARQICPEVVCMPNDFENYGIFSKKIFSIIRRYTPQVEEYSIDEAFADLSGLRRLHHGSYEDIARRVQEDIHREIGITVSVGLSCSKGLAKLASKFRKPAGFTTVPGYQVHEFLGQISLDQVWGFGRNTVALLHKLGLRTALDYVKQPEIFAKKNLGKPGWEIWRELRGECVHAVNSQVKSAYQSISALRTFSPNTQDGELLYARLLRNIERAARKMRRYQLATPRIVLLLRRADFRDTAVEITLIRPTASILDLAEAAKNEFDQLFLCGISYRGTGVVLCDLSPVGATQFDIFEDPAKILKRQSLDVVIDTINQEHGRHKLTLADALPAGSVRTNLAQKQERKLIYHLIDSVV